MTREHLAYLASKCAFNDDYPALVALFAENGLPESEALKSWNNPAAKELRRMGLADRQKAA